MSCCIHKARGKRDLFPIIRYTTPGILQQPKSSWLGYVKNNVRSISAALSNIIDNISKIQDQHLRTVRNFTSEEIQCQLRLGEVIGRNVRAIRSELRGKVYKKWKDLSQRGIGVLWYDKCTLTNSWISNKEGLSSSEWSNAIKASMSSMANRGTGSAERVVATIVDFKAAVRIKL